MKQTDLKTLPGFSDWVSEGMAKGYLVHLADAVDNAVVGGLWDMKVPHMAYMNNGLLVAGRVAKEIIANPLAGPVVVPQVLPPVTYGVKRETTVSGTE